MFFIVNHTIRDVGAFEDLLKRNPAVPAGLTLHGVYPSRNLEQAFCLWEAPDKQSLRDFLDDLMYHMARNEYIEVNEKLAVGLPVQAPH
jgi:hypothetical protein